MFKVFPWISEWKPEPISVPSKWWGNVSKANALGPSLGLPPANWKQYRPSVSLPPPRAWPGCHAPAQCQPEPTGAYGSSHIASSQDGSGTLVTWALFSSGVTAAVGNPATDRLSLLFSLMGKMSEWSRREMFAYTQQLWRDSSVKELTARWLSPLWGWVLEGKPCFFFFF